MAEAEMCLHRPRSLVVRAGSSLGSTQPRARAPWLGKRAPAQAFLQGHCHLDTGPKMGKVRQKGVQGKELVVPGPSSQVGCSR